MVDISVKAEQESPPKRIKTEDSFVHIKNIKKVKRSESWIVFITYPSIALAILSIRPPLLFRPVTHSVFASRKRKRGLRIKENGSEGRGSKIFAQIFFKLLKILDSLFPFIWLIFNVIIEKKYVITYLYIPKTWLIPLRKAPVTSK